MGCARGGLFLGAIHVHEGTKMIEREWLNQRPDASGECDRCHQDDLALWEDQDQPGAFMYCKACWLKLLARVKERR